MKTSRSADDIEFLKGTLNIQGDDSLGGNSNSGISGMGTNAGRGRNDRNKSGEKYYSFPTTYPPPDYVPLDNSLHRARPPILEHNLLFLAHREINVIMNLSGYPLEPALLSFCEEAGIVTYELTDFVSSPVDVHTNVKNGTKKSASQGNNVVNYGKDAGGSNNITGGKVSGNVGENIPTKSDGGRKHHDDMSNGSVEVTVKTITADADTCKLWLIKTLDTLLSLNDANVILIGESSCVLDAILVASLRKLQRWVFTSIICEFRFLTGKKMFDFEQFIESVDLSDVKIPSPVPR